MSLQLGRNELCHCGSGKKYKKCCLPQDEERSRMLPGISASSLEGSVPLPAPTSTESSAESVQTSALSEEKLQYVEKTMAEFAEKMKGTDAKQWEAQFKAIQALMKLQKK